MRSRLGRLVIDGSIALASFWLACWAIVGQPMSWWTDTAEGRGILLLAITYAIVLVGVFFVGKLDQRPWNTVSARDMGRIIRLNLVGGLLFLSLVFLVSRAEELPRSILLVSWFLTAGAMAGARLIARAMTEGWLLDILVPFRMSRRDKARAPILVVGPAARVERALLELQLSDIPNRPVGAVLEEADHIETLSGVRVVGSTQELDRIVDSMVEGAWPDLSLLFVDSPTMIEGVDEALLAKLRRRDIPILRLPKATELKESERESLRLRKVRLEELLSRPPISLKTPGTVKGVRGKRILVTGAGGSIGSELCRQLAALGCGHLTLLDIAETPLFEIDRELNGDHPSLSRRAILADVRDRASIARIIAEERPERIFHAAALKHVSLMETHPAAAVMTNVLGTANVALAARESGVPHMVLVSTDKAVAPTSVMGATKRLAEALVRSLNTGEAGATRFSVVRFGNVLNSNGSIVPIFRSQIETGGPVTVTHPDVERYFMTIPEAVQLILHAAAVAEGRDETDPGVFVLEMGEPVKVMELAQRMIDILAEPEDKSKIAIRLIGLQPGEKLSEALVDEGEETIYAGEGVIEVRSQNFVGLSVAEAEAFAHFCAGRDSDTVRDRLFDELARVRGKAPAVEHPAHLTPIEGGLRTGTRKSGPK
jgi:O-antigen biosynthesis protein WbqV